MYKILVVEDQPDISRIILKYLINEGYEAKLAQDGFEALQYFSEEIFHLVLLDIMMPGIDGFEVLEALRKQSDVPIIMLTAKQEEIDRLKGFEKGADDYVIKPFSPRELIQRIKVFFRRVYHSNDEVILKVGTLKLYTSKMRLEKAGEDMNITTTEYKILHTFMNNQGRVLTRDQIIEQSFGHDYEGFDRNIDSYIKRIRKKIEDNPKSPRYLMTKYGAGYVLRGDST